MTEDDRVHQEPGQELLPIGAFAARARLSPKALRLYDRLGLLAPAHVDEVSGYRYYRVDQVERARTVALLRRLDMPLAGIAEVVRLDGERAARRLDAYWAGAEERFAEQRTLARYLRGRLSGRNTELYATFEVKTVDVPETYVLSETRHVSAGELPAWIGGSAERLERAAVERCGGMAAPHFVVYHAEVTEESDGPAESCVPVVDAEAARVWAAEQGRATAARVRVEPAHRLAYTRITKAQVAYPQIIAAFDAVEAWAAEQGLSLSGPCREVYFADWEAAGPDDAVCDVAFPVSRG
ncbi:MerR family transcriptional regulator [Streptomyces alfalfae]|uniref:MerR family transcriptional regulator n=1 Tax=Streptomyces alfalfae TaxID=1642299 RepID=A0A1P8TJF2_9ACTN|nr:MerR family transcriptional regulator [Streptomyces alfalfae]AYA15206.1 MerR family transcriptional regulator [Streptomyces fradiae]QQC89881.1 MerR family transcriptional regulator [Streptomyces alfalfae]QUI32258.1 MerR family transcriptional regulator [Streptomyces alfalfae]RXX35295.1 MerR family transcriptional regulator [Streptomyces alfalfae]